MSRFVCVGRYLSGRSFTFCSDHLFTVSGCGFLGAAGPGATGQVWAGSFDITTNTTAAETLSAGQTGTVQSGVTLTDATKNTVVVTVDETGTSLTNSGTVSQTNTAGRAVRVTGTGVSFTLTNNAGAIISAAGDDAIQSQHDNSVTIYNSGTIEAFNGGGQAVDLNNIVTGTNLVYNYSTGLIEAFGADALRPGVNGYIYNAGTIESQNIPSNTTGNRDRCAEQ